MSSTGGGILHGAGSGPNSMLSTHGTMDGKTGNGQMGNGPNGKMSSLSGSLYDPTIDVKIRHQLPLLNESPSLRKNRFFFQVDAYSLLIFTLFVLVTSCCNCLYVFTQYSIYIISNHSLPSGVKIVPHSSRSILPKPIKAGLVATAMEAC